MMYVQCMNTLNKFSDMLLYRILETCTLSIGDRFWLTH